MNAGTPPDDHPPLNIGRWKLLDDRWLDAVLDTREADLRAHRIALTYSRYAIHLDDIIHGEHPETKLLGLECLWNLEILWDERCHLCSVPGSVRLAGI